MPETAAGGSPRLLLAVGNLTPLKRRASIIVALPSLYGVVEMLTTPAAGLLLEDGTPAAIGRGVRALLAALPDCAAVRAHGERFGRAISTARQIDLLRRLLGRATEPRQLAMQPGVV